jgi:hypothetical protein
MKGNAKRTRHLQIKKLSFFLTGPWIDLRSWPSCSPMQPEDRMENLLRFPKGIGNEQSAPRCAEPKIMSHHNYTIFTTFTEPWVVLASGFSQLLEPRGLGIQSSWFRKGWAMDKVHRAMGCESSQLHSIQTSKTK